MRLQQKSEGDKQVLNYEILKYLSLHGSCLVSTLLSHFQCADDELEGAFKDLSHWLVRKSDDVSLSATPQWLNQAEILGHIEAHYRTEFRELDVQIQVGSTNSEVLKRITHSANSDRGFYVCLAEFQRQGRGRRGRQWQAPIASNLTFSFGWCQAEMNAVLAYLPLVMGLACAEVVSQWVGSSDPVEGVGVKWPNDVLINGRKLAGLLVETSYSATRIQGRFCVVVGIGMNVSATEQLTRHVGQQIVGLDHYAAVDRNILAGRLLSRCMGYLRRLNESGFESFHSEWRRYDVLRDRPVRVVSSEAEYKGIARGLGEDGALLVEVEGALMRFVSADVSVRLTP